MLLFYSVFALSRSMISQCIDENETGKIYSGLTIISAIIRFLTTPGRFYISINSIRTYIKKCSLLFIKSFFYQRFIINGKNADKNLKVYSLIRGISIQGWRYL